MADGWICPECELWRSDEDLECSCGHVLDPEGTKEQIKSVALETSTTTGSGTKKTIVAFVVFSILFSILYAMFKTEEGAVYKRVVGIILIFGPVFPHVIWKRLFHATLIGGFLSAGIVMMLTLIYDGPLAMLEPGRSYSRGLADGTTFVVDGFSLNMIKDSFSLTAKMLPILVIICLMWSMVSGLPFYFYRKRQDRELAGQAART